MKGAYRPAFDRLNAANLHQNMDQGVGTELVKDGTV